MWELFYDNNINLNELNPYAGSFKKVVCVFDLESLKGMESGMESILLDVCGAARNLIREGLNVEFVAK